MNKIGIVIIALLNGAGIMAFEMICGKMLAPFYGTSLEVWSVTLAIVMFGLAGGYALGGRFSVSASLSLLTFLLSILAVCVALAPLLAGVLLIFAYQYFSMFGSFVSSLIIILPFMIFAGMISPLLTQLAAQDRMVGAATGHIFSVSTLGGVAATFAVGFWAIPQLGVDFSVLIISVTYLLLVLFISLEASPVWRNKQWLVSVLCLMILAPTLAGYNKEKFQGLLYRATGLYGEIMVADIPLKYGNQVYPRRMLLNNRIGQTNMNRQSGCSLWDYAHYLITLAGAYPHGSKSLLLGLAGGNIGNELMKLGYQVDAVDLDPRVYDLASRYFDLDKGVRFIQDDARHYLNVNRKRYDVIIMDLFSGEGVPNHVLTLQSLTKIRKSMSDEASLIINFHGFIDGPAGLGARSVYKTLLEAGFDTHYLLTPGMPGNRNTLFIARLKAASHLSYRQEFCAADWPAPNPPPLKQLTSQEIADGYVLTDEYPVLDRLNNTAYRNWRRYAIEHYLLELNKKGLPLF